MSVLKNGDKFGKLTVRKLVINGDANHRKYLCDCECGGTKITSEDNLKRGHCKSCGCLYKKIGGKSKHGTEHGESKTRLYKIWSRMIWRCEKPSYRYFSSYGGRGITVCDEWHRFDIFKKWALSNGYSDELTIDRINNDGEYSPSNCRWATPSQQANNRRTNRFITYNGKTMTVAEWADYFGINKSRFSGAIHRGNTIEEILEGEKEMGIYLPNMVMPKNCEECDLSKTRHSSLGDIIDCKYIGTVGSVFKDPYNILNNRHPKCPLVEIKTPYGDLIDRDSLIDTLSSSDRDIYVKCMLEEDATVVIEGNMGGSEVMK